MHDADRLGCATEYTESHNHAKSNETEPRDPVCMSMLVAFVPGIDPVHSAMSVPMGLLVHHANIVRTDDLDRKNVI